MQNITNVTELKNAIYLLEIELAYKEQRLKEEFIITCDSFKPVNLFLNTFKEIATSPNLIDNIIGTIFGLASGYISKKIFIGTSGNIFRKLFGTALQFGVSNSVAQHPDAIKSIVQYLFQHIFRKKELDSEKT